MKNVQNDKKNQINEMVSIVKISSFLFVAIILCQYFFDGKDLDHVDSGSIFTLAAAVVPLLIFMLIYFLWTFSTGVRLKNKYEKQFEFIEIGMFIITFTSIIYCLGGNQTQYKLLYLFIIITTTIQSGLERGLAVSVISSLIILSLDLILFKEVNVNIVFQNDLILAGIFILTAWPLGFYVKIENEHIAQLEEMVNIDGLTSVYNHRYFHDVLREEIKKGQFDNTPVSMIFIDIDYFKNYNDLYGHQKGDYVLKELASVIKGIARKQDTVARYGGEEFAIILPNTKESEALEIAEKLRVKIESTYFDGEENQPKGHLTASMGISVYPDKAKDDIELIKSADDALYRAKFFNKNRVEVYTSILDDIKKNIDDKDLELVTSIKTLISVINAKDRYTYGHVERVVIYSRLLAEKLGLSEKAKETLIYGAYIHDIGKINIAKEILVKKMRLTNDEWEQLKNHPTDGVEIIKSVESLKDVIPIIISHHERYDGKGYPNNLKGEEIPYLARVLTVVDSFDAMTSNRPYNNRMSYDEAINELLRCSGSQFDPVIAKAFIEVIQNNEDFFSEINDTKENELLLD